MKKNQLFSILLLVICIEISYSQHSFECVDEANITTTTQRYIIPEEYKVYKINKPELQNTLDQSSHESLIKIHDSKSFIEIPLPNGQLKQFKFVESPVMSEVLSQRNSFIKTYSGESLCGTMTMRFDYSENFGFHAMIIGGGRTIFIDPFSLHNTNYIISYYKDQYINNTQKSFHELEPRTSEEYLNYSSEKNMNQVNLCKQSSGEELRTYRIAIACTQQYSNFHGGTTESTLAGMVTTLNRVNEVYENEVAIRMVMVDNNDSLIDYSKSWGMSNYNTGLLINQSQEVIDEFIGTDNYDIGHTFSTGAGGLASLGVPCKSNQKASGVTGTNSPIGDPYDIDYVAHEIGHQFGANHTFNGTASSCNGNRNAETAYEPGSGTTIMAYAGICGSHNIQSNSDPYFHPASYDEITYYVTNAYGNVCPEITETGNTPPTVLLDPETYIIPVYTAFELNGSGTDNEGDSLTYSWEQMDLGPAGHPNTPLNNAPIFRTFNPNNHGTRVFPRMYDLLNNIQTKGELIPEYGRTLHFRLTVRDNSANGGGVSFDETEVEVTEQAGPFEIISPNGNETWGIDGTYDVEWEVADTDNELVNCQTVNIILMYKQENIWNELILAENVPNDGFQEIQIPNEDELIGSENRIKIVPTNNIFFDISNEDFSITGMNLLEFSDGKVQVYPNPTSNMINIKLKTNSVYINEINLIDLNGKKVLHTTNEKNTNLINLDVSNIDNGFYFIEMYTESERLINTISIQR